MSRKQIQTLCRILAGAALLLAAVLIPARRILRLLLFLVPYLLAGGDVLWRALRNILRGQVFDENFLMAVATIGAFCIGEYPEAVLVMVFYQVGERFQGYAVSRSRSSIAARMDIRPDHANLETPDGLRQADPEEIAVGDVIVVKSGERIPLDGTVLEGRSTVDTAALTGESLPRETGPGDAVISGCINIGGLLRVRVSKPYGESTVAKILDLVENSSSKKARAENFITRFARIYTPLVVMAAVLLAVLPPLLFQEAWGIWIQRALIFLVISCPCALVISIPLGFFGGIGGASRRGILVKGSNYLEALSRAEIVVFDKTGTLTKGTFTVSAVHPDILPEDRLLELAALAESYSDHPISRSLREAYHKEIDASRVTGTEDIPGHGVSARVDGRLVQAGSGKLMERMGIPYRNCHRTGTIVHVAGDGEYAGHIVIADEIKPDAGDAVAARKSQGVRKTVMLTGDQPAVGESVAEALGIDEVHAGLLPADKVDHVEQLLGEKHGRGTLAFVGDGINDAPVLSRADIGIAMGALGSDAAIEAADVVLMDDKPSKIADAIRISRKTRRIVQQNIVFALGVKLLVLVLGACGVASMWAAVFADVGVSVLAILNAMRALRVETVSK